MLQVDGNNLASGAKMLVWCGVKCGVKWHSGDAISGRDNGAIMLRIERGAVDACMRGQRSNT